MKTKVLPSNEIINLKRRSYWLVRELKLCEKHLNDELSQVVSLNKLINGSNVFTNISKSLIKVRNNHLDKHGLLIDLACRIRAEIHNNGKEIMQLRDSNIQQPKE